MTEGEFKEYNLVFPETGDPYIVVLYSGSYMLYFADSEDEALALHLKHFPDEPVSEIVRGKR